MYGGDSALSRTLVDHWLTFTMGPMACSAEFKKSLEYLESVVKPDKFLVGQELSGADCAVFGGLYVSGQWQVSVG